MLGEHREDYVVGLGQSGILQQVPVRTYDEVMMRVHEGAPGSVLLGREPVRFRRHTPKSISWSWLTSQPTSEYSRCRVNLLP